MNSSAALLAVATPSSQGRVRRDPSCSALPHGIRRPTLSMTDPRAPPQDHLPRLAAGRLANGSPRRLTPHASAAPGGGAACAGAEGTPLQFP
jgi:hypothetical protein